MYGQDSPLYGLYHARTAGIIAACFGNRNQEVIAPAGKGKLKPGLPC